MGGDWEVQHYFRRESQDLRINGGLTVTENK